MSGVLEEDLNIIANSDFDFSRFQNKTFLVTGATGLVGSVFIKALSYANEKNKLNVTILAVVRDENKAEKILGEYKNIGNIHYIVADIGKKIDVENKIDYIIHGASITASKMMVENPVGTISTAVNGTMNILELARQKKSEKVIYLSSMEVYGTINTGDVSESDMGYVDLTNVRSCYPESKRMCECLCNAYSSQYGINVVNARLAQTFGPGILDTENRVFAQFARSAINGTDIVLHTKGKSEGNYCYTRDMVMALFILLIKGKPGESYNIANEACHTSISDMAQMVAEKLTGGAIKLIYDIPESSLTYGYAPDVKMRLLSNKMRALGWVPQIDLEEAYRRTIKYMMRTI